MKSNRLRHLSRVLFAGLCLTSVLVISHPHHRLHQREWSGPVQPDAVTPVGGREKPLIQAKKWSSPLPMSFEVNWGQADDRVDFMSRGRGRSLFLTSTEAVLSLRNDEPDTMKDEVVSPNPSVNAHRSSIGKRSVVRMQLVGANARARARGLDKLPGKVNYLIGSDPTKWHADIPTYAKVEYEDVYPGVDLVYYGNQQQLEYDFVVSPGGEPTTIALNLGGATGIEVSGEGMLLVTTAAGLMRQRAPLIYQEVGGHRQQIAGGYVLDGSQHVRFRVGAYDRARPLVIDPILTFSTYLGGSAADLGTAIAVDGEGNVTVTGDTISTDFPTARPLQENPAGMFDIFVSKLTADGSALIYSTYLGGSEDDFVSGLACDQAGNAYLTGVTFSPDFPTTMEAFQPRSRGDGDAFVTRLNSTGSGVVYSTFLGGLDFDQGRALAVDGEGHAFVAGRTASTNFPTRNRLQRFRGIEDGFLSKLSADGSALIYSTYLGGSEFDECIGIALDAANNAFVTGETDSENFPTQNPLQRRNGGGRDAFVAKLNGEGSALIYSTYLGGNSSETGSLGGIAVDGAGCAYVTGSTLSRDFPTTPGAFDESLQDGEVAATDAFVSKLSGDGSVLVYSTYLGGEKKDIGIGIAVDAAGGAYVTGNTLSEDFPTKDPVQSHIGVSLFVGDAFVSKLNEDGSALVYSTPLGGDGEDLGQGISVDARGCVYVVGVTGSDNFPLQDPFQSVLKGFSDTFLTKICDDASTPPAAEARPPTRGTKTVSTLRK